jgi:hypothetical protein
MQTRRLLSLGIGGVLMIAGLQLHALSAPSLSPMASYWVCNQYSDVFQWEASEVQIDISVTYRLEDGTHIGTDHSSYSGPTWDYSGIFTAGATAGAGAIGQTAGGAFGGWAGATVASAIPGTSSVSAWAGWAAFYSGPWVGAFVGAALFAA